MRDRILDAAEIRARTGGYDAFSFRDLAQDVGVKSASVHYHFPTKSDLAQALTQRYTDHAMVQLGDPRDVDATQALARVVRMFRQALVQDNRMCLCGLLAAQRDILPAPVDAEVSRFFRLILDYLRTAFGNTPRRDTPEAVLACLEGALILARALRDVSVFDAATAAMLPDQNNNHPPGTN